MDKRKIRGHRNYVGGLWDQIGRLQFDFLVSQGLQPHHYLLDIACGSLRAGIHFIPYLESGHYLGIDKERDLIEAGITQELTNPLFHSKKPRFVVSSEFEFEPFGVKPDYALAQSLFTHLTPDRILQCLQNLRMVLSPQGKFFATFNLKTHEGQKNPAASHDHQVFRYTREQMESLGRQTGWEMEYLGDWNHPRGQQMLLYQPEAPAMPIPIQSAIALEPIIVVGPGRCGSSAVAGVLHHLGVFMGEVFIPPHATNPYGHWEDKEFVDVNEAFVMQHKISDDEWRAQVSSLIAKRTSLGRPWGWKDPRTCQLMPQYISFFAKPRFVRCRRPAAEVEASFVKAYGNWGWTLESAARIRRLREDLLDQHLTGQNVLEIHYDRLRTHREETVRALLEFSGLGGVLAQTIGQAVEFLRPDGAGGEPPRGTEPAPASDPSPHLAARRPLSAKPRAKRRAEGPEASTPPGVPPDTAALGSDSLEGAATETTRAATLRRAGPVTERIVFIAGLHRSGTSIVVQCLREHPAISGMTNTGVSEDEGQHLQTVYPPAKDFGGPGRFGFHRQAHLTERSSLANPRNARGIFDAWSPYWDLRRPFLVEKSPPNVIRTRFLQALFPSAWFVFLLRHPVAVSGATFRGGGTNAERLIRHWLVCHRLLERDLARIDRFITVRYEDFVRDSNRDLAAIHKFLGIDPIPTTLHVHRNDNDKYFGAWQAGGENGGMMQGIDKRALLRRYERGVRRFGYSLADLGHSGPCCLPRLRLSGIS